MKLGILPIGRIDAKVPLHLQQSLVKILPNLECSIIPVAASLLKRDFDPKRKQYRSNLILAEIQAYSTQQKELDCVLGLVDADIFVPELNFVFGVASFPGKEALISLWRLRREFYGGAPDEAVFMSRLVKEAVHEIGHTLGLRHCTRSSCVMHFSNSIVDTDIKRSLLCDRCHSKATTRIQSLKALP